MSRPALVALAVLVGTLLPSNAVSAADGSATYVNARASVDAQGRQARTPGPDEASVSDDGARVVFPSCDTALTGNASERCHVLLWQRSTRATTVVDLTPAGMPAAGGAARPALSGDGGSVAFWSSAPDLVPGDTDGSDLFVRDLATGLTRRVPLAGRDETGGADDTLALSRTGRYLVYEREQVYRYDRVTDTTVLVSRDTGGRPGQRVSWDPAVSADGQWVAFTSESRLVPEDTNTDDNCAERYPSSTGCLADVYLRDVLTGRTSRVSVDNDGRQARNPSGEPAITADGGQVSFSGSGLDRRFTGSGGTFVRDLRTGTTTLASRLSGGAPVGSYDGRISADGTAVAFTRSVRLTPGQTGGDGHFVDDVVVRDLADGTVRRASIPALAGPAPNGDLRLAAVSGDGDTVLMIGDSSNLVPHDTNGVRDLFVRTLP